MDVERIEKNGKIFAQIPIEDFEALLEDRDMLEDIAAYDQAVKNAGEFLPAEFTYELSEAYQAGKSLIPLWREYRSMIQSELAERAGIPQSYLSAIESGKKPGSVPAIKAIALALNVTTDDLI